MIRFLSLLLLLSCVSKIALANQACDEANLLNYYPNFIEMPTAVIVDRLCTFYQTNIDVYGACRVTNVAQVCWDVTNPNGDDATQFSSCLADAEKKNLQFPSCTDEG